MLHICNLFDISTTSNIKNIYQLVFYKHQLDETVCCCWLIAAWRRCGFGAEAALICEGNQQRKKTLEVTFASEERAGQNVRPIGAMSKANLREIMNGAPVRTTFELSFKARASFLRKNGARRRI